MVIKHLPTAVNCGPLTNITNGAVDTSSGTTFMMTATYTCDDGYTLAGGSTRMCGDDGQWTPIAPICNRKSYNSPDVLITFIAAVDCMGLSNPIDGMVALTATTFESTATYSCNTGLSLTGEATRTCEDTGAWSGSEPTCDGMLSLCGLPTQGTY